MLEEQINLHIRDQLCIERYMTGHGQQKIAERFGISKELARHYLRNKTSSLPKPKNLPITNEQIKKVKDRKKLSVQKCREAKYEYIKQIFLTGCELCGETDPFVLEFDHIDPSKKKYGITKLICSAAALSTLIEELDKCRILCSNCHRRHTHEQNKSWRWQMFGDQSKKDENCNE
jgi:hypothetical protein